MSLLGSLLGGPGGSKPSTPTTPTGLPARSREPPNQALKREISSRPAGAPNTNANGTQSIGIRLAQPPLKRKASDEPDDSRPKAPRSENAIGVNGLSLSVTSNPTVYRGTAGLDRSKMLSKSNKTTSGGGATAAESSNSAPSRSGSAPAQASSKPAPSSVAASRPALAATQAAPKKGSYAEIMARASAVKAPVTTGIQNKAKEPIISSKKAKAELQANVAKSKADARKPGAPHVKTKDQRGISSGAEDKAQPPKRKPIELAYKGTARPAAPSAAPAYKGTMGMARKDTSRAHGDDRRRGAPISKYSAANRRNEYLDDDELDELDDDDMSAYGRDEEDYYSDASSDMEANLFDVDREEAEALRAAKREDQEEQAKLEELEREKRRKKQAALVKSLAEKKERRRFM